MTSLFFFFNDTATTEIYTLSLHDALPILAQNLGIDYHAATEELYYYMRKNDMPTHEALMQTIQSLLTKKRRSAERSEEHTSELQSRQYLVCRLLLEKKKNTPPPVHEQINQ